MSQVAIFRLACCNRQVVFGRFRGSEVYLPSMRFCPNGCIPKTLPSGKSEEFTLKFEFYADEKLDRISGCRLQMISPEREIKRVWQKKI